MSETPSDDLIRTLAADLTPVRPIPRLRVAALALLATWLAAAGVSTFVQGLRPDLPQLLLAPTGPGGVLLALALAGCCGVLAALAQAVPGRERAARAALLASLAAMGWAAGIGTLLILRVHGEPGVPVAAHLGCLAKAGAIALLPALTAIAFAARAAPLRPLSLVVSAAAGTAALGAAAMQASCSANDPQHLMLGHVIAPVIGAFLLTLPLLVALRRLGSREQR